MNQSDGSSTLDQLMVRYSEEWMAIDGVEAVGVGDNCLKVYFSVAVETVDAIPEEIGKFKIEKIFSGKFGTH